ncbi:MULTISPECIES: class II aldolase/adducin family protein [unclassified Caballeronia]|uniref:class II aldolase/adducin family protein n=1 Tax=unclassified Caballeronia TaxID=2646786 RepID=UPI0028551C6D|nr:MULTISPECIES: class II aldolase/adducin family protein [unclassified Caballeronia]MDR5815463.1 class II aldolase/adducin family protein [Caballeronia sp. LZ033]MDR5822035.1 class II aldolase/adducin family protein [Caballeronia sp. LZ043]
MLIKDRPPLLVPIETEADARLHLCALYRLLAHYGLDDTIFTHASAKVPGEEAFLINPYGLRFEEVTPGGLLKVDYAGFSDDPSNHPANAAGYVIHSALLSARPDIGCVVHTHTRSGVALSCLEDGLLPINQFAIEFHDRIGMHEYEGLAFNLDEGERLRRDIAGKVGLILRNHGLLAVGPNIPAAFYLMYYLEQSAQVQMDVLASGRPFVTPSRALIEKTVSQFTSSFNPEAAGHRMWPSMLRLLDEKYPGWRED